MTESAPYQVLARKYRPQTFADLIGQDVMVRTLRNAFASDRVAHAFVLTGVRGVGKTTTARIVAKGLNCTGPDGKGGMTIDPCGVCASCRAIAEGRHIDVLEYDAASHTKVDEMRDILASLPYRPTEARFKVIIFDEVHMLSGGSFNALLKTLEEPPEHVKFIFATTEIRKVPVTILSRCQRFDLRRIEPETLTAHLSGVLAREGAEVAPEALALIVRAAEGSVRDALSLLDQAIAHGAGATSAEQVRAMLGLADRGRVIDLFDLIMKGSAAEALSELGAQYASGGDPMAILRDLAEVTHWLTVLKIAPETADDPAVPPDERERGKAMSQALPIRVLSRTWQMLLKSLEEVAIAPNAMMAAEMAVIRLTHVADLPDPEALMRRLSEGTQAPVASPSALAAGRTGDGAGRGAVLSASVAPPSYSAPSGPEGGTRMAAGGHRPSAGVPMPAASPEVTLAAYPTFESIVALIREKRDMKLLVEVESHLRLVSYAPGRIEFEPAPEASRDLAASLTQRLQAWTGARWGVSVVASGGAETIAEMRAKSEMASREDARTHPLVAAVFDAFPGARITAVRPLAVPEALAGAADATGEEASDQGPDDWDPFEDQ